MLQSSSLQSVKILVIDDNRTTLQLVMSMLHNFGAHEIRVAENGEVGLEMLTDYQPDVIILDWAMEPVNGIDFTKIVRNGESAANSQVPIVMLTSYSDPKHVIEARDAGISEFLAKPFAANTLLARIKSALERPRSFVRSESFSGPDRRRQTRPIEGPDRRQRH